MFYILFALSALVILLKVLGVTTLGWLAVLGIASIPFVIGALFVAGFIYLVSR